MYQDLRKWELIYMDYTMDRWDERTNERTNERANEQKKYLTARCFGVYPFFYSDRAKPGNEAPNENFHSCQLFDNHIQCAYDFTRRLHRP